MNPPTFQDVLDARTRIALHLRQLRKRPEGQRVALVCSAGNISLEQLRLVLAG